MRRHEQIQTLLNRSSECELLAQVAADLSIRQKCAELAIEYRSLANRMRSLDASTEMSFDLSASSVSTTA